jgi:hypothetical protein
MKQVPVPKTPLDPGRIYPYMQFELGEKHHPSVWVQIPRVLDIETPHQTECGFFQPLCWALIANIVSWAPSPGIQSHEFNERTCCMLKYSRTGCPGAFKLALAKSANRLNNYVA